MPLSISGGGIFFLTMMWLWCILNTISNQLTTSMNGQQRSEQNLAAFLSWGESKTDADFREMTIRGQLSRQEIAKECGFAKSVLLQNPRVKDALKTLEARLRARGVLPPQVVTDTEAPTVPVAVANPHATTDKARLKRLEAENAALRAEVLELRGRIERYRVMDNVLCSTGRLPR